MIKLMTLEELSGMHLVEHNNIKGELFPSSGS